MPLQNKTLKRIVYTNTKIGNLLNIYPYQEVLASKLGQVIRLNKSYLLVHKKIGCDKNFCTKAQQKKLGA